MTTTAAVVAGVLATAAVVVWVCVRKRATTSGVRATRDTVVEMMREGVIVIDEHESIVDANPAAERLLGGERLRGVGSAGALPDWLRAVVRRTAPGEETESLQHDVNGRVLDITVAPTTNREGTRGHRIVVMRDATARAHAERRLENLAHTDSVTGLPNRLQLDMELTPRLAAGERLAFMLLDLDGFKAVNDTYGHSTGDDLLRETGRRLRQTLDPAYVIARLNGDEFVVVATCVDEDDALRIAGDIAEVFAGEITAGGHRVHMFASIGVAVAPCHATDVASIVRCADVAMYRAKRLGVRTALYRAEDEHDTADRLQLIFDLRGAIARGELELHYQPVVNLRTRHGVGCEALVRWRHPRRGLLLPGAFLSLIEDAGLGRDFSRWVVATSLRDRVGWPVTAAGFQVGFNLSVTDLSDRAFIDDVLDLVQASGLRPTEVVVEITETVLLSHHARAEEHDSIDRLLAHGLRLVLDDFGTGHASVTALRDMRGALAKIAGVFVVGMKDSPHDRSLVAGLASLARSLDYGVLAEWIEDAETLALARDAGCRFGQGFFLASPMPSDELAAWILRHGPGGTDLPQPMMDLS